MAGKENGKNVLDRIYGIFWIFYFYSFPDKGESSPSGPLPPIQFWLLRNSPGCFPSHAHLQGGLYFNLFCVPWFYYFTTSQRPPLAGPMRFSKPSFFNWVICHSTPLGVMPMAFANRAVVICGFLEIRLSIFVLVFSLVFTLVFSLGGCPICPINVLFLLGCANSVPIHFF